MNTKYLVKKGKAIAIVHTNLKTGETVKYSTNKTKNALNASREYDLVNANTAIISKNKKYDKNNFELDIAVEINEGEFLI